MQSLAFALSAFYRAGVVATRGAVHAFCTLLCGCRSLSRAHAGTRQAYAALLSRMTALRAQQPRTPAPSRTAALEALIERDETRIDDCRALVRDVVWHDMVCCGDRVSLE
jgi:hypothetical protein